MKFSFKLVTSSNSYAIKHKWMFFSEDIERSKTEGHTSVTRSSYFSPPVCAIGYYNSPMSDIQNSDLVHRLYVTTGTRGVFYVKKDSHGRTSWYRSTYEVSLMHPDC